MRARLIAALLLVLAAAPTMAQAAGVEIGLGYAYLRDDEIDESFPLGWYADIAGNISNSFGLVAEVGGSYKTIGDDDEGLDLDINLSVHSAMGGLRLMRRGEGANLYLQVLAGAARASIKFEGESESITDFAVQPGLGFEFGGGSTRIRIGADYRRIFSEGEGTNQWRATAGIVFGTGN